MMSQQIAVVFRIQKKNHLPNDMGLSIDQWLAIYRILSPTDAVLPPPGQRLRRAILVETSILVALRQQRGQKLWICYSYEVITEQGSNYYYCPLSRRSMKTVSNRFIGKVNTRNYYNHCSQAVDGTMWSQPGKCPYSNHNRNDDGPRGIKYKKSDN